MRRLAPYFVVFSAFQALKVPYFQIETSILPSCFSSSSTAGPT